MQYGTLIQRAVVAGRSQRISAPQARVPQPAHNSDAVIERNDDAALEQRLGWTQVFKVVRPAENILPSGCVNEHGESTSAAVASA